jgi:hypothetical protein
VNTLQKIFESVLLERGKKAMIDRAIKLIERKVKRAGTSLTKSQKIRLRNLLLSEQFSSTTLRFRGNHASVSRSSTFTRKDSEELERYYKSYLKNLERIVEKVSESQARLLLSTLKRNWPNQRAQDRRRIKGFEQRLVATWKVPLDLLEMHIHIALEFGARINDEHRKVRKLKRLLFIEVLTRLHARSCQVASEILVLLKSGFADGAMARWRTLHEIAVTALFIGTHGEDAAKRYLRYDCIESYKGASQYQRHCKSLGYEPFTSEEMKLMGESRSKAISEFGESFDERYGWAAAALKIPKPNFSQIEDNVRLDHLRPYYKMASQNVHADPKGVLYRLGLTGQEFLLAGPSNIGLVDPAHSLAISLLQITSCLLLLDPILDNIVMARIMMTLCDEIGAAFFEIHKEIEAREKQLRSK